MTLHTHTGAILWNSSACSKMACHKNCGITCSTNQWKLAYPYFSGCFGTWKDPGCTFPASRKAKNTSLGCAIIGLKACHHSYQVAVDLLGGGNTAACSFGVSNCGTGTHPYYGEANRVLMASLGVTTTNQNLLATVSWSS